MNKICLAFDTSNYTTSVAWFDGENGENAGRLLEVPEGRLGLRQSEALFAHIKRLPEIMEALKLHHDTEIAAIGAASKPREGEDSYMPCFLAGLSQGSTMAMAIDVPFFAFSHQQGHIAAAAWSSGRMDVLKTKHLSWHLSGGTTELLLVEPDGLSVHCKILGGTNDLSAGQLIDRAGGVLGLSFPSGRELDSLACAATAKDFFAPKVNGLSFSLSGVENKVQEYYFDTGSRENTANYAIRSIVSAIERVTRNARDMYGDLPVLFAGGVSSNRILRELVPSIYPEPRYSTDNAMGIAILAYRQVFG